MSYQAGHQVHHSSDEYNLTTALRQSVLFAVMSAPFALPAAFFIPLRLLVTHREINTLYQFWIHTRLIGKLPWPLEFIFVLFRSCFSWFLLALIWAIWEIVRKLQKTATKVGVLDYFFTGLGLESFLIVFSTTYWLKYNG